MVWIAGSKIKRGRTAVKGKRTVGLTEGRKDGRKDYQLSVQSPAGFVIGGPKRKRWPCVCCQSVHITTSTQLQSHHPVLRGFFIQRSADYSLWKGPFKKLLPLLWEPIVLYQAQHSALMLYIYVHVFNPSLTMRANRCTGYIRSIN